MIQTYFTQIKRVIEQYAATSFVLEATMHIEMRPGDQGYLTGALIFADDSTLRFSEYLDQTGEVVDKHLPTQIIAAPAPTLDEVLAEIATTRGWV